MIFSIEQVGEWGCDCRLLNISVQLISIAKQLGGTVAPVRSGKSADFFTVQANRAHADDKTTTK